MPIVAFHWVVGSVFAVSAAVCFLGAFKDSPLQNQDARHGLTALLVVVGLWALLQAIQMFIPIEAVATGLFTASLVVGFGTVWAWLWFVSAYTGHNYHRRRNYQLAAIALFAGLTAIKLTNPFHGLYFTAELATSPYPRLLVDQGLIYWVSFGLAYGLTAVGFYLLFQAFRQSAQSATTLGLLFAITGLSIFPKAFSALYPELLPELSYEPLGVAIFALGALYLVEDTFTSLETPTRRALFEATSEAIIVASSDGQIVNYNEQAADLFPTLDSTLTTVNELAPELAELSDTTELIKRNVNGAERYFLITAREMTVGAENLGCTFLIQDVTEAKRRKREIDRHNKHLEEMAGAIAHELRNTIAITRGYLNQAQDELPNSTAADDSITVAGDTLARMRRIVDDLHALTKYAQSIESRRSIAFRTVIEEAYDPAVFSGTYHVDGSGQIEAAPDRFQQLLVNAFRFAAFNDAETITFTLVEDGFIISDDGQFSAVADGQTVFEYEAAAPSSDAGMMLPNVRTLAEVQGWQITADTEYDSGMRYRISGATVTLTEAPTSTPR